MIGWDSARVDCWTQGEWWRVQTRQDGKLHIFFTFVPRLGDLTCLQPRGVCYLAYIHVIVVVVCIHYLNYHLMILFYYTRETVSRHGRCGNYLDTKQLTSSPLQYAQPGRDCSRAACVFKRFSCKSVSAKGFHVVPLKCHGTALSKLAETAGELLLDKTTKELASIRTLCFLFSYY